MSNDAATTATQPDRPDRRAFLAGAGALLLAGACAGSDTDDTSADLRAEPTSVAAPPDAGPADDAQSTEALADEPAVDEPATEQATAEQATADEPAAEIAEPTEQPAPAEPTDEGAVEPLTAAMFAALPICALLPSSAAGPFPSRELLDRRDVTEGYPGHPLRLGMRVVDADCAPLPGARVEIWHTDATGDYSSYTDNGSGKDEGEGSTFMRGIQTADDDGILEFQTIYPGWYEGRAVHIHTRVWLDDRELLTAQLYFDEGYTADVYSRGVYAEFGQVDTPWSSDGLIDDPATDGTGIALTAAPTSLGPGTLGLAQLGVST